MNRTSPTTPDLSEAISRFNGVEEEYRFEDTIFSRDTSAMREVKRIVQNLDAADRKILILYAETQSLSEVALLLGISKTSMFNEITRIRKIIKRQYEQYLLANNLPLDSRDFHD